MHVFNDSDMNIGQLDTLIEIQQDTNAEKVIGAENWQKFCSLWAKKMQMKGMEKHESVQTVGYHTVNYKARYREGIKQHMRLVDDGENYNIEEVYVLGRREGLMITATKNDN